MIKKYIFSLTCFMLIGTIIINNLASINIYATESNEEGCSSCTISEESEYTGESIEDYVSQYTQFSNDEKEKVVQSVINSSYYKDIENTVISSLNIYKTNASENVVYTSSYQLVNGTAVFMLNNDFNITSVIVNEFDSESNSSIVKNLVNQDTKQYYYNASPYVDCKTFVCEEYKITGGSTKPICGFLVGMACTAIGGPAGIPGYVICYAGTIIACNNPADKTCVRGSWRPVCPM